MTHGQPASPIRLAALCIALCLSAGDAPARQWSFVGVKDPVEAGFVAESNGYVVLKGANGKSFELPLTSFSPADRKFIQLLASNPENKGPADPAGEAVTRRQSYKRSAVESLTGTLVTPDAASELHLTGTGDPLSGSSVHFTHPDGWLFFDRIPPSVVNSTFLKRMLVNRAPAKLGENIRVVAYGSGSVVIPHGPDFPALTLYTGSRLGGEALRLKCHVDHGVGELGEMSGSARSLILKRGYMATLAENENGTGVSRNYVAQDHDVVIDELPKGLAGSLRFVRVFPWRWTTKKGIAGGIHQNLKVGWFYNWNISDDSSADLEYVPIKQKRYWPGLNQDWKKRGSTHLLGYNEPDKKDQADMSVKEAIRGWPELLGTGLRLGSPSTSDGGLEWLYQFMDEADRAGLRVDFVTVHYYRAASNPGDAKGAAEQFRRFLQQIHDRVKRPLWVTEWNNGANWTKPADPNPKQQRAAVKAMIEMLDETPFVERYALFNWVESSRELVRKDGSLTPAGEVYRDHESPVSFRQP